MSERIVAKAGGTSNKDAASTAVSMEWAEKSAIFVASAPGAIEDAGVEGSRVTQMLLEAREQYKHAGYVDPELKDVITNRYAEIVASLGWTAAKKVAFVDGIGPKIDLVASISRDMASMLGERLQAQIYQNEGFRLLDPSVSPHDLGSDRHAWRGWLESVYVPGERHVLIGNTTKVNSQLVTFSRGGSDTSGGFAAYGISADLNLNLTDGGAKSAHPDKIARTKDIDHMLYDEGRALGRNGTGLVHPEAMIPLKQGNITTEIRSTFENEAPYTRLDNDYQRAEHRVGRVIALSLMTNVVVHRVQEDGMAEAVGRLDAFESELAKDQIALIDSQGHGTDAQKYLVSNKYSEKSEAVLKRLVRDGSVESTPPVSFVTLVGFKIEERYVDNLINITIDAGIDIDARIKDGLPAPSSGRDSLRIAVHADEGETVLSKIHSTFIESEPAA